MTRETDPLALYTNFAENPEQANKKWGELNSTLQLAELIPNSASNCLKNAAKLIPKDKNQENIELRHKIAEIFQSTTRNLGVWTERVEKNLEIYTKTGACLEVGHQPKFLGGERFLLNKIACGGILARNSWYHSQQKTSFSLLPFLFIGDYDKVHRELTRTVIPSINAENGKSLHIPKKLEKLYTESTISHLPLPSEVEFQSILEDFRNSMNFSFKTVTKNSEQRQLWEARLEHGLTLLKTAYFNSLSSDSHIPPYTRWFGQLIGVLSNIIGDYGYTFVNATDPRLQTLFLPHYEYLLKNREEYIRNYQEILSILEAYGFRSTLRAVEKDFVPFFAVCSTPDCHGRRITLRAISSAANMHSIILEGVCDQCKKIIQIETASEKPDLWDLRFRLTPRVDSRQFLVSSTIKPQIHVAGTGETRYYMHDLPLISRLNPKISLAQIYFYNKITRNTPWTRALEPSLHQIPDFLDTIKVIMKASGKLQKMVKNLKVSDNPENHANFRLKCLHVNKQMKMAFFHLEQICLESLKNNNLPESLRQNILPVFLANFFGRIRKEKHGQTSVFHWTDLLITNGMNALFQDYERIYRPWQIPGQEIVL